MNATQRALLELSQKKDLSSLSLRQIGQLVGVDHPQVVKYHIQKLEASNLLQLHGFRNKLKVDKSVLGKSDLITIAIVGSANCGPATMVAEENIEGYLKVSSALLKPKNYKDLYALKAIGSSMNKANLDGKPINDGDYVIVDGSNRAPQTNQYVVATMNGLANIKKFYSDEVNNQIVLLSESSQDFLPIFIHPEDNQEGIVSGVVVQVIRNPQSI